MTAALITAVVLGLAGLVYSALLGYGVASSADLLLHTTAGIFAATLLFLGHSMTMFYLIGKGRAIREAVTDGGLPAALYNTVVRARAPVFSKSVAAMAATMAAALLGGGVDTDVVPTWAHTVLAFLAIGGNVAALWAEIAAFRVAAAAVTKVNALLAGAATGAE